MYVVISWCVSLFFFHFRREPSAHLRRQTKIDQTSTTIVCLPFHNNITNNNNPLDYIIYCTVHICEDLRYCYHEDRHQIIIIMGSENEESKIAEASDAADISNITSTSTSISTTSISTTSISTTSISTTSISSADKAKATNDTTTLKIQ